MSAPYQAVTPDEMSPDKLVVEHAELVKRIAYHLVSKMPQHVEVDDLIQAGMIGLLSAAQNYSPDKGANFETYAGIRIRGAMLDEARKSNWAPRSTFKNAKLVSEAIREIENQTGRDAKSSEVAEALDISVDEYHQMLERSFSSKLMSFERLASDPERSIQLPESPLAGPEDVVEEDEFRDLLAEAIDNLPEREKLVLSLYYDDELNLREIGEVLEVSESRVCQIHGQAVLRIRARLKVWLDPE